MAAKNVSYLLQLPFFLAKGQIIDWQSATLLVLIGFCLV